MAGIGIDLISSNQDEITSVMKVGRPVAIVVGGFDEMLNTKPDRDTIYLRNRKGFIKLAIKHGYSVTPVYCFGECQLYHNGLSLPSWLSKICMKWKIPAVFPIGRSFFDFSMPSASSQGLLVVFGPSVKFEKCKKPTKVAIEKAHAEYVSAVSSLYNKYNPYPDRQLEII
jgi:2-acylglycerol O-acyltransferase 2